MKLKTNEKAVYKATYYDYLLAVIIIILFSAPLLSFVKAAADHQKAIVYLDNKIIKQVDLSDDKIISVGKMLLEVKGKKIHVLKTDCPNKICQNAGWISAPGQSIVCLPNKLVVEIPVDHKNGSYDIISY